MRENVKRKLVEFGISGHTASEIMCDIFGKEIDDEVEEGLIHCSSAEEFDSALQSTTSKWKTCHMNGHRFVEFFLKAKANVIREAARSDIRSMRGLGYPPTVYTQNANECMNCLIKAEDPKFSKKQVALLPYIERIRAEIKRQQDKHSSSQCLEGASTV